MAAARYGPTVSANAADRYPRIPVPVLDTEIAYVDTGAGEPVVFLYGPAPGSPWGEALRAVADHGRCLEPDLPGSGDSTAAPGDFDYQVRLLDGWFDLLALDDVVLVVHGPAGALGLDWARRHPDQVVGVVHQETPLEPFGWPTATGSAVDVVEPVRAYVEWLDAGGVPVLELEEGPADAGAAAVAEFVRGLRDREHEALRR